MLQSLQRTDGKQSNSMKCHFRDIWKAMYISGAMDPTTTQTTYFVFSNRVSSDTFGLLAMVLSGLHAMSWSQNVSACIKEIWNLELWSSNHFLYRHVLRPDNEPAPDKIVMKNFHR